MYFKYLIKNKSKSVITCNCTMVSSKYFTLLLMSLSVVLLSVLFSNRSSNEIICKSKYSPLIVTILVVTTEYDFNYTINKNERFRFPIRRN